MGINNRGMEKFDAITESRMTPAARGDSRAEMTSFVNTTPRR